MFRLIFVFGLVLVGIAYSFYGAFYVLLFYLWNAYFRPESWVWSDLLWSFRLSLIIGGVLLIRSARYFQDFKLTRQTGLILLFFIQSTVSLLLSNYFAGCLPFWTDFLKVVVVTLLITILVNDERRFRLTLLVISLSLAFEAAKQGWAQLVLNPGASNNNTHPMLGDNNGVALGMMMLVPLLTALAQTSKTRWERYIHQFLIVGIIYRAISTYSRGGFISAAVVFILTLWRSNKKIRTLLGTAIVAYALFSVMPDQFWGRMNTIDAPEDQRDDSALSRLYFWGVAEQMANDHPLFGVGPNGFRYAFAVYDKNGIYGGERAVHSIWFGLISEVGYPGLLLFVAIFAGCVVSCQRVRTDARRAELKNLSIYATHLQTSVVVYAVGGSFLNVQYLEFWWHVVGLTIALQQITQQALVPVTVPEPQAAVPTVWRPATELPRQPLARG